MRPLRRAAVLLGVTATFVALAGCGPEPAKKDAKSVGGKDLPSFKEGKGLWLSEETRKSIGLELAEVSERSLNRRLAVEVQVYEATTGAVWRASGLVSKRQAEWLRPGQAVWLSSRDGQTMEGKLAGVDGETQAAAGQTELIFEMPAAGSRGAPGDFFTATMTATNQEAATSIPVAALLRSAQGDFVYVANGERLLRTAVTVGGEADGFVQITNGLYAGDRVAVKPVEMLWLSELRLATAGGD